MDGEALGYERRALVVSLALAQEMEDRLEEGREVPADDMETLMRFLVEGIEAPHRRDEEGRLFPAMERAGMDRPDGPVAQLETEHLMGREYVGRISEGIDRYRSGNVPLGRRVAEELHGYVQMLRGHLAIEEDVIEPQLEAELSPRDRESFSGEARGGGCLPEAMRRLVDRYLLSEEPGESPFGTPRAGT